MTDDYRGFRITTIHAITTIGDDDQEGVPAWRLPYKGPTMPLIAADPARLADIKKMAQIMADATGQTFKLVKFSVREEVGEITPGQEAVMTEKKVDWEVMFSDQAEAKLAEDPEAAAAVREALARMRQVLAEFEAGRFASVDEALMSIGMEKHAVIEVDDDDL